MSGKSYNHRDDEGTTCATYGLSTLQIGPGNTTAAPSCPLRSFRGSPRPQPRRRGGKLTPSSAVPCGWKCIDKAFSPPPMCAELRRCSTKLHIDLIGLSQYPMPCLLAQEVGWHERHHDIHPLLTPAVECESATPLFANPKSLSWLISHAGDE
jgi:hypothetical protein